MKKGDYSFKIKKLLSDEFNAWMISSLIVFLFVLIHHGFFISFYQEDIRNGKIEGNLWDHVILLPITSCILTIIIAFFVTVLVLIVVGIILVLSTFLFLVCLLFDPKRIKI